jgi:hypothetical protein
VEASGSVPAAVVFLDPNDFQKTLRRRPAPPLTVAGNVDYGVDDGVGGDGDETQQEARGAMPKSG